MSVQHYLHLYSLILFRLIPGVKNNIAAFGGDPDNITAMGQSVGASSIGLHLTSYRGQRGVPFHKAMFVNLPPPSPPLSPKS